MLRDTSKVAGSMPGIEPATYRLPVNPLYLLSYCHPNTPYQQKIVHAEKVQYERRKSWQNITDNAGSARLADNTDPT